jgi:hypothetical protein
MAQHSFDMTTEEGWHRAIDLVFEDQPDEIEKHRRFVPQMIAGEHIQFETMDMDGLFHVLLANTDLHEFYKYWIDTTKAVFDWCLLRDAGAAPLRSALFGADADNIVAQYIQIYNDSTRDL